MTIPCSVVITLSLRQIDSQLLLLRASIEHTQHVGILVYTLPIFQKLTGRALTVEVGS